MTKKPSKTTRAAAPVAEPLEKPVAEPVAESKAADEAPETVAAPTPEVTPPSDAALPLKAAPPSEAAASPDEEMKRKFREAMERKNPASGSEKTTHGDKGPAGHASAGGPTQRMFRRKAGG